MLPCIVALHYQLLKTCGWTNPYGKVYTNNDFECVTFRRQRDDAFVLILNTALGIFAVDHDSARNEDETLRNLEPSSCEHEPLGAGVGESCPVSGCPAPIRSTILALTGFLPLLNLPPVGRVQCHHQVSRFRPSRGCGSRMLRLGRPSRGSGGVNRIRPSGRSRGANRFGRCIIHSCHVSERGGSRRLPVEKSRALHWWENECS